LTLIFQSSDIFYKRADNWKLSTLVSLPAAALAYYSIGTTYMWAYPMLFSPTFYQLYDLIKLRLVVFRTEVYRMYLLQNGD
jgi:hypothetical protein